MRSRCFAGSSSKSVKNKKPWLRVNAARARPERENPIMKDQKRVHRNGATKTAALQAKIRPLSAPAESKVNATDNESLVFDALTELEMAKNQSLALTQLMLDSETHHMMEGDLNHDERNQVNAGVCMLLEQTNRRLDDAYAAIFHTIGAKREQVASRTPPNLFHSVSAPESTTAAAPGKTKPKNAVRVVFRSDAGRKFCRVDFPKTVYARIRRACKKLHITLDEFFHQAITCTAEGAQ